MDISNLSPSDPAGGEALSNGASRIRDIVLALQTSFGIEHALAGVHKFLSGNAAARPAAGNADRLYLNTTDRRVERDDGSSFVMLHAVQPYFATSSSITTMSSTPASVLSVTADILSGAYVFALATAQLRGGSNAGVWDAEFRIDGVSVLGVSYDDVAIEGSEDTTLSLFGASSSVIAGSHTIDLYVSITGTGSPKISRRAMGVLVL